MLVVAFSRASATRTNFTFKVNIKKKRLSTTPQILHGAITVLNYEAGRTASLLLFFTFEKLRTLRMNPRNTISMTNLNYEHVNAEIVLA